MTIYDPMRGSNVCPVCGWPFLADDPHDQTYEICPSCGVEVGYEWPVRSAEELRIEYLSSGARFWAADKGLCEPPDWKSPYA